MTSQQQEKIQKIIELSIHCHNLNKKAEKSLELTLVQYRLLIVIRQMPTIGLSELSRKTLITPGTLTQSTNRLLKKKLIEIIASPKDKRKKMILLTIAGQKSILHFENNLENFVRNEELTFEKIKALSV